MDADNAAMNFYETTDLNLATVLMALGCNLLHLDRVNPRRVVFCFEKNANIEAYTDEYWTGALRLPALALFTQQKLLKQRLYSSGSSDTNA